MMYVFYFLFWTLILYGLHRLAHANPLLWYFHSDHHQQIATSNNKGYHWSNYFLFFDTWRSTGDQWLIEILPTIILCSVFNDYTLFIFYYIWAVFIQERIEHNPKFDIFPILTSGKWHLVHHEYYRKNYGVFTCIWDLMFNTYQPKNS